MYTIIIDRKEYKIKGPICDLIIMISKERDELQKLVNKSAGFISNTIH